MDPTNGDLPGPPARDWRIWLGLCLTFGWLLLAVIYVETTVGWNGFATLPADTLGSFLEGAFAPLAFLWLVIGYFLQQKELSQNTQALREQFREIARTAEQAVIQSETSRATEIHARQDAFLRIAERVSQQLGTVMGMLYISSQGSTGNGSLDADEQSKMFAMIRQTDASVFSRRMLELHLSMNDPAEQYALFYGTSVRARHSNNFIRTFERLVERALDCDPEGMIAESLRVDSNGLVYRLAKRHQAEAPPELADPARTGAEVRF